MRVSNADIAEIFSAIGAYLEMADVPFKPRAYERVAEAVRSFGEDIGARYAERGRAALKEIPGVGESIADHIEELVTTGRLKYYEELKKKTPVDLATLTRVEGLGPKKIKALYQKLKVRKLADLERAARAGKIATLPGFGKKTEENILKGIDFVKRSSGRVLLGEAMPEALVIVDALKRNASVSQIAVAGSLRRRRETIGDVDILVVSKKPGEVMDAFTALPQVARVYAKGPTKSMVRLRAGFDADLRVVSAVSYGAALNYFTGSKDHNVALRKRAIAKGMKLNEYGLYKKTKNQKPKIKSNGWKKIAGETEEGIYRALELTYIEPEMREMAGELELAQKKKLPKLIGYGDLRGDLQTQTDWTDGKDSIEAMARSARDTGLEYIAVTDHTKRLAMTHGLDARRLREQMRAIDKLNHQFKASGTKFRVLKGTECDILKDGSLDLPDEVLKELDVVGISVHSHFNLSRKEQTARVLRAMQNPHADILFHPTGRIIHRRDPYDIDIDAVIAEAKRTKTVLEIDAHPSRLDLKDDYIRLAVRAGVRLSIDSDAHAADQFEFLEYGVAQARRGWAEKSDVINTRPAEQMLTLLKR